MATTRSIDFVREGYRWIGTYKANKLAMMRGPRDVVEFWASSEDMPEDTPRPPDVPGPMWGKTRWFRYVRDAEPAETCKVQHWPGWLPQEFVDRQLRQK